jgi:hypothetical protein
VEILKHGRLLKAYDQISSIREAVDLLTSLLLSLLIMRESL